jgi:hypothetical protein
MATMAQFSRNIRKRGSQVENAGARIVRRTAKRALKVLVNMTPVDTGLTRSNWRVSIGSRTYATIPAYSPGRKLGMRERANANAAISEGFSVINRLRPGRGNSLGSSLYITNNTPYLEYIHKGAFISQVDSVMASFYAVLPGFRIFSDNDDDEE